MSLFLLPIGFLQDIAKANNEGWEYYKKHGNLALQNKDNEKAQEMYEKAIKAAVKANVSDNQLADISDKLGDIYFSKKEYEKAKEVQQLALNIRVWNLGPNDPKVATALTRLAGCFWHLKYGRPVAQALYFRALKIREQELGKNHPDVADSLMTFGGSLDYPYGRLPLTIPYWKRALEIREENLGLNDLKVADSLSSLAFIYDLHSDYEKAEELYERALDIREKNLGPTDKKVLQSVYNLGTLYGIRGNETAGEEYKTKVDNFFRKHMANLEENLGPNYPDLSILLSHYASWLNKVGRDSESKEIYERAVSIREKVPGSLTK